MHLFKVPPQLATACQMASPTVLELSPDEGSFTVNSVLIGDEERGYILVDTGLPETWTQLDHQLRGFLVHNKLRGVVLTHLHPDHCGAAAQLLRECAAWLAYHENENLTRMYPSLLLDSAPHWLPAPVLDAVRGFADAMKTTPYPSKYLVGGTFLHEDADGPWLALHTPGHTPGHICIYNPETSTLVSGDHLLPNETSNIPFYPLQGYNPLRLYLESLAKVMRMGPKKTIPAHGKIFTNVQERIVDIFVHHRRRLREAAVAVDSGESSIQSIAAEITWSRGRFLELKPLDQWLAILETLSHLEFLTSVGYIKRVAGETPRYILGEGDWGLVEKTIDLIMRKSNEI